VSYYITYKAIEAQITKYTVTIRNVAALLLLNRVHSIILKQSSSNWTISDWITVEHISSLYNEEVVEVEVHVARPDPPSGKSKQLFIITAASKYHG